MASDNFNNVDGTLLFTHNANWANAGGVITEPEIRDNQLRPLDTGYSGYAVRRTDSSVDLSDVVFIGNTSLNENRRVGVRSTLSLRGYEIGLGNISGTNYTSFNIFKNGTWVAGLFGLTIDGTVNHTMRITATDDAGNVVADGFMDGVLIGTWTDTASVLSAGNPSVTASAGAIGSAIQVAVDDWTDGVSAGIAIPVAMKHFRNQRIN